MDYLSFIIRVEYDVEGSADCNRNRRPDGCDVAEGNSVDLSGNSRPDECDGLGDVDDSGDVDHMDAAALTGCMRGPGAGFANADCDLLDFDRDRSVDLRDYQGFQLVFGFVPP